MTHGTIKDRKCLHTVAPEKQAGFVSEKLSCRPAMAGTFPSAIYLDMWKWPVLVETHVLELCSLTEMRVSHRGTKIVHQRMKLRDSYYFCHQLPQTYWLNKRHTFTVFLEVKIPVSTGVNIPVGGHRENVLRGLSHLAEAAFLPGSQPVLRLHGQQQRAHCVSHWIPLSPPSLTHKDPNDSREHLDNPA